MIVICDLGYIETTEPESIIETSEMKFANELLACEHVNPSMIKEWLSDKEMTYLIASKIRMNHSQLIEELNYYLERTLD